ncbi:hypothetical protein [Kordia jejudonensis]|uniref:hypothetical protein n=1 Tax=Kordia jejudonensis TaxID=1348245 RepID=UPI0006291A57|nr:hypothetical protein [Kordia jejudonensis]
MKSIQLILLTFFAGVLYTNAQTMVFDQEYYFIAKGEVKQLKQIQDSVYISDCNDFQKCNEIPRFSYKVLNDSVIDKNTKTYILKGKRYNHKNRKAEEKKVIITKIKNNRIKLQEVYGKAGKRKLETSILYATSELVPLKPISEITQEETEDIFEQMVAYMNYLKTTEIKREKYMSWEKINDLVIAKGYSPIGADEELGKKSEKF